MKRRPTRHSATDRENRRQEILRAAIRLFAEHGMENVSFGEIARTARLSRPLVYFYFPDLQTLFLEAVIIGSGALHQRFLAAAKPGLNGLARIMAIGGAYVRFAHDEPHLFQLLAHKETKPEAAGAEHPLGEECRRHLDDIMGVLVAALQKGVRDGSIRRDLGDPDKVAVCLWGLTHGLIQITATRQPTSGGKPGAPFTDLPEFGLDLVRRSLAAPRPRRA